MSPSCRALVLYACRDHTWGWCTRQTGTLSTDRKIHSGENSVSTINAKRGDFRLQRTLSPPRLQLDSPKWRLLYPWGISPRVFFQTTVGDKKPIVRTHHYEVTDKPNPDMFL